MSSPGYPTGPSAYPVAQPGVFPLPQYGYPQPSYAAHDPSQQALPLGFLPYPSPAAGSTLQPPSGPYYSGPVVQRPPAGTLHSQDEDPGIVHAPLMAGVDCPPGLECLAQIDQVLIHQKVEILEALTSFETRNKYLLKNSMGQCIYSAKESSNCCARNCCGSLRCCHVKLRDHSDREVIHLVRPLRCTSCCFPCCLQESPPGTTIAYVRQTWHPVLPKFSIHDVEGVTVLRVVGPCFTYSCCGDVAFQVKPPDESRNVGRISKQWSGLVREAATDADNFGVQFPKNLDVKMKAALLGACFLIDFVYFERGRNDDQRCGVWQ
ncbi:phospholipid scramblase 1-like isoform X2 [Narcine bancroftii]|uniref:phospholipid scramblase 1-like isoform X2 n=1 Tax=Narcine bancroftii TaxID=1343680 RepID=UPI0038313B1A